MMDKLPVFEMVIDDTLESDVEVQQIAFVDKPAIEKNFMAFKRVELHFATDPQRQIVSGPAMVPDTLIYRRDLAGEYNVFFSKETIEKIALKFFKKDYQKNLNLFHDPNLPIQGVTIFESFVSDKSRGIQPMKGFEDLPDGTWFISAKVENPDVWNKIQTGEVKGFSVEGIFSYVKKPKKPKGMYSLVKEEDLVMEPRIERLFKELRKEVVNRTDDDSDHVEEDDAKSIIMKVTEFLADIKKKYFDGTPLVNTDQSAAPVQPAPAAPTQALQQDYQTKDGQVVQIDKLEVGGIALMGGVPAPAGELQLQDGTSLTIGEGGVITLVTPAMAPAAQPALTMAEVEMAIDRALAKMREAMATETQGALNRVIEGNTLTLKKQGEQIGALFTAIEKLAEIPTADPVNEVPVSFSKQKAEDKVEKRNLLIKYLKDKKTA